MFLNQSMLNKYAIENDPVAEFQYHKNDDYDSPSTPLQRFEGQVDLKGRSEDMHSF